MTSKYNEELNWWNKKMIKIKTEKKYSPFATLLKTYLKSNRKRLRFSLLFTILFLIFACTLLLTWFGYQNISFQKYSAEIDWFSDQNFSSFTKYTKVISNDISADYLDSALLDIKNLYVSEFPNIISEITGTIEVLLRGPDPLYGDLAEYTIKAFDRETMNALTSEIINGNFPQNYSELLLLYSDFIYQDYFNISDILQLKPNLSSIDFSNYSISGVITNLEETLELYNYSPDLVLNSHRNDRYEYYSDSRSIQTFITTPNYLFELLNNYTQFSGTIILAFDIMFNETAINYSNIENYKSVLTQWMAGVELSFDDEISIKIGADLLDVFEEFQQTWTIETIKIGMTGIIVIFLFILVIFETMSFNRKELQHTFRLMKIQGLDNKNIRKIVFFESIIIAVVSLLIGLIFSIGTGFVLTAIFKWRISFCFFFSAIINPLFLIITLSLFCLIFLISFCLKMNYSNKSRVDICEHLTEKNRKGIRKFLASYELISFIIGALALSGSIPGIILFSRTNSTISETSQNMSFTNAILLALLLLGSFFIFISLISIFSKFIAFSWSLVGKYFWKKNKGIINLSLKNISQSYQTYQRIIMISMFIGFGLLPGFIIYPSINTHLRTNSLLASSYSDLVIYSWNDDDLLEQKINNLSGINCTTITTQLKFNSIGFENAFTEVDILAINVTEFVNVINNEKIDSLNQNSFNFNLLANNMTCFINKQFVKEYGYNQANKIDVRDFWDSINEYQLTPIADFKHFPLIPNYKQYLGDKLFDNILHMQLVLDIDTFDQLTEDAYGTTILNSEQQLLIRLNDGVNITDIQALIYNDFNIIAKSYEDIQESYYNYLTDFNLIFVIISSISSIFILYFNGYITGQDIYQQRSKNIEADYRLGATKNQIFFEYTLEIFLIVFLPLIFSVIIGIISSQYYHLFLNIDISYLSFKPWIPWWLVILIFILSFISILFGWGSNIYTKIRGYKPIKEE